MIIHNLNWITKLEATDYTDSLTSIKIFITIHQEPKERINLDNFSHHIYSLDNLYCTF